MILRDYEQMKLLKRFPPVELSYEKHSHKKVHDCDIYYAIPMGKKFFAWFTYYKGKNVCIVIELSKSLNIVSMKITPCCFHSDLSYGTLLFGTIVNQNQHDFFAVEDIYHYKGDNLDNLTWDQRTSILSNFFMNDTKPIAFNRHTIVFANAPFNTNYNKLITTIDNLFILYTASSQDLSVRANTQTLCIKRFERKYQRFLRLMLINRTIFIIYTATRHKINLHSMV